MAIVQARVTNRICATCAFWGGPRELQGEEVSFNNRESGICGGPSFKGWSMGAVSTCTFWESRYDLARVNESRGFPDAEALTP